MALVPVVGIAMVATGVGKLTDEAADGRTSYRTYAGRDHVAVMEEDSPLVPELIRWTHDRFAGDEPTPDCHG